MTTAALKINEKIKVLHSSLSGLETKALDDGSVTFEGWANKAIVDRGRDLITKKEWRLDNYKKNSIVLFNHDHSRPVGKMVTVEAREEGLYVKGKISNSKDKDISRVRDLVSEGILNSLSVGIMVGDEEKSAEGNNTLKNVELHEVSIVAVPMNQDSQFTIAAKALAVPVFEALGAVAEASGYADVVRSLKHLSALNESLPDTDSLDYIAENLSVASGVEKEVALDFLRLKLSDTPAAISVWIASAELKGIESVTVHAIQIPKSLAASQEEAVAFAEGTDWKVDAIEETEAGWNLIQEPAESFEGELRTIDLGKGIVAILGSKKAGSAEESTPPPAEGEAVVMDDPVPPKEADSKGLLDDQGLTTPVPEMDASKIEVNPALDQMKQTNVLLGSVVSLLQQLSEKMDMMQGPGSLESSSVVVDDVALATGETNYDDEETELVKLIDDFVKKSNERLGHLGL